MLRFNAHSCEENKYAANLRRYGIVFIIGLDEKNEKIKRRDRTSRISWKVHVKNANEEEKMKEERCYLSCIELCYFHTKVQDNFETECYDVERHSFCMTLLKRIFSNSF